MTDFAAYEKRQWLRSFKRRELIRDAVIINLVGMFFGWLIAIGI